MINLSELDLSALEKEHLASFGVYMLGLYGMINSEHHVEDNPLIGDIRDAMRCGLCYFWDGYVDNLSDISVADEANLRILLDSIFYIIYEEESFPFNSGSWMIYEGDKRTGTMHLNKARVEFLHAIKELV